MIKEVLLNTSFQDKGRVLCQSSFSFCYFVENLAGEEQ